MKDRIAALLAPSRKEKARENLSLAARNREAKKKGQTTATVLDSARAQEPLDVVTARATGYSTTKINKASAVVAAAASDPATFGDLPAQMDETGNVAGAYREMKRAVAFQQDR